jgi:acyl-CoA reductase-like NAD-dependent aldehyde dehydrogenase
MSFQTIIPATGETLHTFPMASDAEAATPLKTTDDRYNNDWKLRPVAARAQIELSAAILDYYADRAEEFLKPQPLAEASGSVVVIEPIGVLIAIEPWNFPTTSSPEWPARSWPRATSSSSNMRRRFRSVRWPSMRLRVCRGKYT